MAPGNNTSAGKRRSGRARPGNATLRATLAECAHGAARTKSSQFYDYHRMLAGRIGYKRAILATAHKLLRVLHTVLREDRPYTDPDIDYEKLVVERNAPRWIRMLQQSPFSSPPGLAGPRSMKPGRSVAAARHRGARIQPAGVCRDHEFLCSGSRRENRRDGVKVLVRRADRKGA